MKVRTIGTLVAALGVWAGSSATAQEPSKLKLPTVAKTAPAGNEALADACAAKLTKTGSSLDAEVKLTANAGTITITGLCKDDAQKKAMLEDIRVIPGVKLVRDGLKVGKVAQTQAIGGPLAQPVPTALPPAGPMPGARFPAGDPIVDPIPVGPGGGFEMGAPPLPNNAWPTYAPYNNVSRVAYPTAYPHSAFPFIGPYYPFPKVPLGWRKVTLEWEDGHWWLGRKQAPVDYWRVRFGY